MSNGVTVIFGRVRTRAQAPSMRGLSGPPAGRGAEPERERCGPGRARAKGAGSRAPSHEATHEGRGFTRRVRTFVGG